MDEWFAINDIDEFTEKTRAIVYNNFGKWKDESFQDVDMTEIDIDEQEEFDRVLSHQESLIIIKDFAKKQTHKTKNKIRYLINDKIFVNIIESLNSRMISNILSSLVSKGLVESSYDSETNDFVFWVKDNIDENKKPKTD